MSFDLIFLDHRESLIATIYRIVGCPETAEDLAHEAYLRFTQAAGTKTIDHPKPFLYQIGRNLAIDHLRKQIHRHPAFEAHDGLSDLALLEQLPSSKATPEQEVADRQEVDLLFAALAGLSERRRQILILNKLHQWPYDRIAAHLDISRSAVEKNMQAALAHLLASLPTSPF